MMRWKRGWLLAIGLAAIVGVIGCSEWESSGDAGSWDDSLNGVDFSGVYQDLATGVLVQDASVGMDRSSMVSSSELLLTTSAGSSTFNGVAAHANIVPGSVLVSVGATDFVDDGIGNLMSIAGWSAPTTEPQGTATGAADMFAGILTVQPVRPGSLTLIIAGFVFTDDGVGGLSDGAHVGTINYITGEWTADLSPTLPAVIVGAITATYSFSTDDATGSIVYSTGAWAVNLSGFSPSDGTQIRGTYRYTAASSATAVAGSTGTPIYTFNVLQTGDRLRIIDSNGNVYNGQLYDVNTTAGNLVEIPTVSADSDTASVQGEVIASFIAEGSAYGQWVTLDGTFVGNLLGTTPNTMFDRHLNGTWRESGGQVGVFFGSAASDAVPLPEPEPIIINNP
ncbi:MAG: hypothetical protein QGH42_13345 [Kiritimatiellia bacterium]|jgi:hypothetical protein|nr:hypothetical protein [Kiritimatiellia bacterium]MDP6810989.1 hypothetical protein [Kiritimatiellia bacterium]MDP7025212.1 hypothetical protein [Kiritimatiellia bacterium]